MYTETDKIYDELYSGDRLHIVTVETKEVTYDIKITPEIIEEFNRWKAEMLEITDTTPTQLEILNYFMKVDTPKSYGGLPKPHIEIKEMTTIRISDEDLDRH